MNNTRVNELWYFINEHQDESDCAQQMSKLFSIPLKTANDLVLDWAMNAKTKFAERLQKFE
jgi:hypothetical protein